VMSAASGQESGSVAGVVFVLVRVLIVLNVLIVTVTGPAAHSFVVWSEVEAGAAFHVGRTESPF
jgi:hypothetical protein